VAHWRVQPPACQRRCRQGGPPKSRPRRPWLPGWQFGDPYGRGCRGHRVPPAGAITTIPEHWPGVSTTGQSKYRSTGRRSAAMINRAHRLSDFSVRPPGPHSPKRRRRPYQFGCGRESGTAPLSPMEATNPGPPIPAAPLPLLLRPLKPVADGLRARCRGKRGSRAKHRYWIDLVSPGATEQAGNMRAGTTTRTRGT
jgi:hypothetical protein